MTWLFFAKGRYESLEDLPARPKKDDRAPQPRLVGLGVPLASTAPVRRDICAKGGRMFDN